VIDIETAFLYGNLAETIYMTEPVGYHDILQALQENGIVPDANTYEVLPDEALELIKSIYGFVQAAKEWYRCLWEKLLQSGYKKCLNDPCLFYRSNETVESILCVYVEDSFGVGDKVALEDTVEELGKDFIFVVNKEVDEYLECKIKWLKEKQCFFSQISSNV